MPRPLKKKKSPSPPPPPQKSVEIDAGEIIGALSALTVLVLRTHVTAMIATTSDLPIPQAVLRADQLIQAVHDTQPTLPKDPAGG